MSFARAFSTRRDKPEMEPIYVGRAATQRGGRPVIRTQISSPMALVSTSNVHLYTAQRIAGTSPIEIRKVSQSSIDSSSSDESEASFSSAQSNGTITDASSIDDSPISTSPEPNYLTSYFKSTVVKSTRSRSETQSSTESNDPDATPRLPQRAPSHSKAAHEVLHRKRSLQRMLSPPPAISDAPRSSFDIIGGKSSIKQSSIKAFLPPLQNSQDGVRSSFDIIGDFRPETTTVKSPREKPSPTSSVESPQDNPFDRELAQLREVADGFGHAVRTTEEDADVMHMEKQGLATFSASDYMFEIQSLIHTMFADEQPLFKHLGGFF